MVVLVSYTDLMVVALQNSANCPATLTNHGQQMGGGGGGC